MPVTDIHKDLDALTMTVTAEFDAPVARAWQLWENPRELERWWGPPTYPATVVDHDLTPGGLVTYFMTGPEGDQHHGWWRVRAVDAPHRLEFEDGFGDAAGNPAPDMPTTIAVVGISERPEGGTRMVIESTFSSRAAMDQVIAMGMEEGIIAAIGQIDEFIDLSGQ